MFIYLSKKIAIPNNLSICTLSWNKEEGWIACGGHNGLLKVLKLEATPVPMNESTNKYYPSGIAAPNSLTMNQTLEGHSGSVTCSTWNTVYKKLTTSDEHGLIIVWSLHKGLWYEEMINNRNQSIIKDMKWTNDGQKICIIYEDGAVIVGSVDGNRLWGKDLEYHLSLVEWSPDNKNLMFITKESDIYLYDSNGIKINCLILQSMKEEKKTSENAIVCLHWYDGSNGYVCEDQPTLVIGLRNGYAELNRGQLHDIPILIDTEMLLSHCQWSPNGSIIAFGGIKKSSASHNEQNEMNIIQFYTHYGEHLRSLVLPGNGISAISWEGSGLHLGITVDTHIYFGNVRPSYSWAYADHTLIYAYTKPEHYEHTIMFWNTKCNEKYQKTIKSLVSMKACKTHCLLVSREEDQGTTKTIYSIRLCDLIGTPLNNRIIKDFPIHFSDITTKYIILASAELVYVWQYKSMVVSGATTTTTTNENDFSIYTQIFQHCNFKNKEYIFHIDDQSSRVSHDYEGYEFAQVGSTMDPITSLCCNDQQLIIGRHSGTIQCYSLPHLSLLNTFHIKCRIEKLAINCTTTRLGIIDSNGIFSLMDISNEKNAGQLYDIERKECWDIIWAKDNPYLFALMERAKLTIIYDLTVEEPIVPSSGYLCHFENYQITSILFDEIMKDPENIPYPQDIEMIYPTKVLYDIQQLLHKTQLLEAFEMIEKNPHVYLWELLGHAALENTNFLLAEKCYIRSKQYTHLQQLKKIRNINDTKQQKAAIDIFFERYDEAEKIYHTMDRNDLAVQLRQQLGDWVRVIQLLQSTGHELPQYDALLNEAYRALGIRYMESHKYEKALKYFLQNKSTNIKYVMECYFLLEEYEKLYEMIGNLPEKDPLLLELGNRFERLSLTEYAIMAYIKSNEIEKAIEVCIHMNAWEKAIELSKTYHIEKMNTILLQYASYLLEDPKRTLQAVELYRQANQHLKACELLKSLGKNGKTPLECKKYYLLFAFEIELYRQQMYDLQHKTTIQNYLQQDSMADKSIENPWKYVEAYHLYMLAHRQFYENKIEQAFFTAMKLMEYEDILNSNEIYSLIAITAYMLRFYEQCSKAFIALSNFYHLEEGETDEETAVIPQADTEHGEGEEKETYAKNIKNLALQIFSRIPVVQDPVRKLINCPSCKTSMKEWSTRCTSCDRTFRICMLTGRTIIQQSTIMCKTCLHACCEEEMKKIKYCPLCHSTIES